MLRSYLRALQKATRDRKLEASRQGLRIDFLEWAQHYVEQLDPLSNEPHDPDLKEDRSSYMSTDDRVMKALARALGHHWQDAWKIDALVSASPSVSLPKDSDDSEDDDLPTPMGEDALDSALDDD